MKNTIETLAITHVNRYAKITIEAGITKYFYIKDLDVAITGEASYTLVTRNGEEYRTPIDNVKRLLFLDTAEMQRLLQLENAIATMEAAPIDREVLQGFEPYREMTTERDALKAEGVEVFSW